MSNEILDIPLTLPEIKKNRAGREERKKKKSIERLKSKFDSGTSIFSAFEDDKGKKHISREMLLEVVAHDIDDVMSDEGYTTEELDKIRKSFSQLGAAPGILMAKRCPGGEKCLFKNNCELAKISKAPEGKNCPIEQVLFKEYLIRYIESMNVDPLNQAEMDFCNELVECDLYIMRMNILLAQADNVCLTIDSVRPMGNQLMNIKELSPYVEARERMVRRRERLIKLMVGDRQEKYKKQAALKIREENDEATMQSKKASQIYTAVIKEKENNIEVQETNILTPDSFMQGEESE